MLSDRETRAIRRDLAAKATQRRAIRAGTAARYR